MQEEESSNLSFIEAVGGCAMMAFAASAVIVILGVLFTANFAADVGLKIKKLFTGK